MNPEFYDPLYDVLADHDDTDKCNACQIVPVEIDGDVCAECYDAE